MNIVEYIKSLPNMRCVKKASDLDISIAENELGLSFSEEYKSVLKNLGAVRACGHEINGFTDAPAINVIEMTKSAREFEKIPNDMYVFESLGIDDIMMLQNASGEVFQCYNGKITHAAGSILDYLKSAIDS